MQTPKIPENERERLAVLKQYAVLDTPPDPELDAITRLIAHICGTPAALVSLIDEERQWFKSNLGIAVPSTPRDISVCGHAINSDGLFVIPDLSQDPRFVDNPLIVNDPRLRFYAGAVLQSPSGHALGTLCVLDQRPRELSAAQLDALQTLASHVTHLLEHKRLLNERRGLIAMVAHDLRNPLGIVSLSADRLRGALSSERSDLVPTLDRLDRASRAMQDLLDDLLDYETSEQNGLPLNTTTQDLAPFLTDTVNLFHEAALGSSIAIEAGPLTDAKADIDPKRMRQVLGNLIGNALKVVPAGGSITIACEAANDIVRISVRDTGPGLSAEAAGRVFEPFWRGETASKGAGLGLAIAKRIVESHAGTIGVDSVPGRGATFWIELPLRR